MTSMDEISLPANGQFGPFKFINMCVVDSILMATYCCYLKTDQVRSLFGSHKILRATMVFMGAKMYDKAKACWLFAQKVLFENSTIIITEEDNTDTQQLDAWSEPTDHLNIFNELVLVKYHYDEDRNSPPDCISQEVLINILRYSTVICSCFVETFYIYFLHLQFVHCILIDLYMTDIIIKFMCPHKLFLFSQEHLKTLEMCEPWV